MLSTSEYRSHDATALAALVNGKEVTAQEVLECAIKEMDRLNPALNAIVMRNDQQARKDASTVDTSLPLSGVPFLAKDVNVQVKDFQLTHACRYFSNVAVSEKDSLLVKRWREAGLVIPAKSNTPEFATDFGCEPELYGPTKNPWNLDLTPGGSSGGASAAVAAGIFPMAHASDSGGSIRVPASCCGVFGFKPSSGLVATGAEIGPLVGGLNCDHAVTRTVRDSALLLNATAGPDAASPFFSMQTVFNFTNELERPPGQLRIGFTELSPTGLKASPDICSKLNETVTLLEALGHRVELWSWPENADPCDVASVFWIAETAAVVNAYAEQIGRLPEPGELGPLVQVAIQRAHSISAVDMVVARGQLRTLQLLMADATQTIDVLLTPMMTEAPLPIGLLTELVNKDVDQWMERAWQFAPYPEIFNVTGQPAMSVPLHHGVDGVPIGMHFVASVGDDQLLLRLARQLEQALPWGGRFPPGTSVVF